MLFEIFGQNVEVLDKLSDPNFGFTSCFYKTKSLIITRKSPFKSPKFTFEVRFCPMFYSRLQSLCLSRFFLFVNLKTSYVEGGSDTLFGH